MNPVIVVVYSPVDVDGNYTDVYSCRTEATFNDSGHGVAVGYCIIDLRTGFVALDAADFHETLEEAEKELEEYEEQLNRP